MCRAIMCAALWWVCCTVVCCGVQCCAVLCSAVLCCTVVWCAVVCSTILYCIVLWCAMQYYTAVYCVLLPTFISSSRFIWLSLTMVLSMLNTSCFVSLPTGSLRREGNSRIMFIVYSFDILCVYSIELN
jgi:hypothetical protein